MGQEGRTSAFRGHLSVGDGRPIDVSEFVVSGQKIVGFQGMRNSSVHYFELRRGRIGFDNPRILCDNGIAVTLGNKKITQA